MRQVGVLAAAGLIALEEMPHRLGEDHANARFLAGELAKLNGLKTHPERVQTNIVVFDVSATGWSASEFTERLKAHGVLMNEAASPREVRAVTHYDVTRDDCARAVEAVAQVLTPVSAPRTASDTRA
jgi:threonine aldolase